MTPAIRQRLVQLLGMCGIEFDGERAAAALAADRLRHQLGLTWDDLVAPANATAPPPSYQGLSQREALTPAAIASALGKKAVTIRVLLAKMLAAGEIGRLVNGKYWVAS